MKKSRPTCPHCQSRATKLINLSTGKALCQICGWEWPIPREKIPALRWLGYKALQDEMETP